MTTTPPPPPPATKPPPKMRTSVKLLLWLGIPLVVLAAIGSQLDDTKQEAAPASMPAQAAAVPVEVPITDASASTPSREELDIKTGTATQLWRMFDKNEVAAAAKLEGHLIEVKGRIKSIDLDAFNNVVVRFDVPNEFGYVSAALLDEDRADAAKLVKGQQLTVLCGKAERIMGDPYLKPCRIESDAMETAPPLDAP